MTGTESQIEWARRIRDHVAAEFDRTAAALLGASAGESNRSSIAGALAILEDKRQEVLSNESAGYFIQEWQEAAGKVRLAIARDPRFAEVLRARSVPADVARPPVSVEDSGE